MYNPVFYIIIAFIIFDFILERVLESMNNSRRSSPVPDILKGIYDEEKYQKQQNYAQINSRFSTLTSSFSFILIVVFLFLQGFGWLNQYLSQYISQPMVLGLIFFGVLFLALDLVSLPFSIYDTFVIEQKFGFNKSTPRIFITDKLKGYLLSAVIGGVFYIVIYKLYQHFGNSFWLYCWMIIAFFMLFITMFYSNLIVPLFNKQKPLPDGELKDAISSFAGKVGFKIRNIYEIDGSKRSTKANAYFTGIGPKKRIVLYDTLIKELSTNEIVAVLAHEIGHYKKKHTQYSIFISIMQLGVMLYLLSLFISNPVLSKALGSDTPVFHIGLVAFALLYSPISSLIGIIMNIFSRKNEYQADRFAAEQFDPESLITALKKLAGNNLSNLTPHPAYVFVNYSHPPLFNRVLNLISVKI